MPFPIDGLATGLEQMLEDEERIAGFGGEVWTARQRCVRTGFYLVQEAYKELKTWRKELEPREYERVKAASPIWLGLFRDRTLGLDQGKDIF